MTTTEKPARKRSARAFGLGEVGEVKLQPQILDANGRWVNLPEADRRRPGRWRARCYYRSSTGERRELSRFGTTQAKARAEMTKALAERERTVRASDGRITPATRFVVAGKAWIDSIARSDSGYSVRTVGDYTATWARYIDARGSAVRDLSLSEVNDAQRLRGFLRDVADRHGDGAAHMCKSVLSGILRSAELDGILTTNAMLTVRAVKAKTPKAKARDHRRALTREEREHLISVCDASAEGRKLGEDGDAEPQALNPRTRRLREQTADFVAYLCGTGVRLSEARLARWEDLDLAAGRVHVRGTKSGSADRWLNLPPWLAERLLKRHGASGGAGYVFAAPSYVPPNPDRVWDQSNASGAVRSALDAAGLDWAIPHSLRRTAASLLDEAGVPIARIADQLGHADPSMTARVYLGRDRDGSKADLAAIL